MQTSPAPRRGLGLVLARAAALVVSLGVVTVVTAQAGGYGCKAATSDIGAEALPASTPAPPVLASTPPKVGAPTPQPQIPSPDDPAFLGGSKAPSGDWAKLAPAKPARAEPSAAPASSGAPAKP